MPQQQVSALNKRMVYVTGLPRSGSTLLCQLLGIHQQVYSVGHSSPLSQVITGLRHQLSDNQFLLAQLDSEFDLTYQRLLSAFRGFINGWFAETELPWVVDKNRGWLNLLDIARLLDPDCRMLVCVREPGQIYGSIESRHQKTLLLDFPDHLAALSPYARADKLFAPEGVIGAPLKAIEAVQDIPERDQSRLYYVVFEHLISDPVQAMADIWRWLGLQEPAFDPEKLPVKAHETDSYYRFKYPHQTSDRISPPRRHPVPARIEAELQSNFSWFYKIFYPGML